MDALLIPALALSIPIVAIVTRHRRRLAEMELMAGASPAAQASAQAAAQASAEAARRIEALETRVAVLERIVTDANRNGSLTLAAEIESLRQGA